MADACKNMQPTFDVLSITENLKKVFDFKKNCEIVDKTIGQNENHEWVEHREGRITASHFSSVLHLRFTENEKTLFKKKNMGKNPKVSVPSRAYGTLHEPIARQLNFNQYKKQHKNAYIRLCGLFVDHEYPVLEASSDGLVKCKCCGEGLLEIRVFLYQNIMPQDACTDNQYHVVLDQIKNLN